MNLLFDITHPAHFHLFKNFIVYLKQHGHTVVITSRKKDVLEHLLDDFGLQYFSLSSPAKSVLGMFFEMFKRNKRIFQLHKKYKFEASFGTSVSIGFLNLRYDVPAYNFNEDDDLVVRKYTWLAYPFATKIINPDCIQFQKWKKKRVLYPSFHELAYLHPNNYKPNPKTLNKYSLQKSEYYIIRLSALEAHHDNRAKGISETLLNKILAIGADCQVVKSIEKSKSHQIEPHDMHDIIAFAKAVISDSQTMTIEAAVLGVPSIRVNTFVGKSTVITQLEEQYQLTYGYLPDQEKEILHMVARVLGERKPDYTKRWKKLLEDKIDFNNWMISYFNKQILHT